MDKHAKLEWAAIDRSSNVRCIVGKLLLAFLRPGALSILKPVAVECLEQRSDQEILEAHVEFHLLLLIAEHKRLHSLRQVLNTAHGLCDGSRNLFLPTILECGQELGGGGEFHVGDRVEGCIKVILLVGEGEMLLGRVKRRHHLKSCQIML